MVLLRRILSYFSLASNDPEVMVSQVRAFTKQAPLLYIILNANVIALAYTHYAIAPTFLTVFIPSVLFIVCFIRIIAWRMTMKVVIKAEAAKKRLQSSYILTGMLGAIFAAWALCLVPYGDAYAKSHVAFFMSITVIGCVFCLMHVRPAALLLTAIVGIPFTIRFATMGEPVLAAIAINFCLVSIIIVVIIFTYNRDFTKLVHSQTNLAALNELNFELANQDSLTDLPNRRSFLRELTSTLNDHEAGRPFALGLIDLDGFKPVNDVFGHASGDRVLIEVGRRLRDVLQAPARVARFGGDEFAFIIPVLGENEDVARQADKVCEAIQLPISLPNGTARIAASIGLAFSTDGTTQESLLERADYALYHAKFHHRGTTVTFSAQHDYAIRVKSLVEQELRKADFNVEMSLKFQPIVDAGTEKILAYEALARWENPKLGHVSPLDFIAAAERTGLINKLTEALFAKALDALKTWPDDIDLSFNLSARDVTCAGVIARIGDMIATSGVSATRIAFEITETALMNDFEDVRARLHALKSLGAQISLDDFGTGYSSYHYLQVIPLHKIKIDRSFVTQVTANKAGRDIVKSIVDLCRNLKLTCIVEGVETAEQVMILRALGCVIMQGYYFGHPAENKVVIEALAEARRKDEPVAPVNYAVAAAG